MCQTGAARGVWQPNIAAIYTKGKGMRYQVTYFPGGGAGRGWDGKVGSVSLVTKHPDTGDYFTLETAAVFETDMGLEMMEYQAMRPGGVHMGDKEIAMALIFEGLTIIDYKVTD